MTSSSNDHSKNTDCGLEIFLSERNHGLEKGWVSGLEQNMYKMNLGHVEIPDSKEAPKTTSYY